MPSPLITRRKFLTGLGGLAGIGAAAAILSRCESYPLQCAKLDATSGKTLQAATSPRPAAWPKGDLTATWIGHSTVLLNFCGTTILTDPVMGERIAPPEILGANYGLRRHAQLPLAFGDLPPIDLVLLSHAHYDHWDMWTLRQFSAKSNAIVPRNDADLLDGCKFASITELDWGHTTKIGDLAITAVHVEHWGARWGAPEKDRGYNGYIIEGHGRKIFFGGDTAYQNRDTGAQVDWPKRVGQQGFDLCLMPIGAYFYHMNHETPEEAWTIHTQLKGDYFLPIHWHTFALSPDPLEEAIVRLRAAAGPHADKIVCDQPGKVFALKGAMPPQIL
jgi:L-ascorbate metabolism protein UlaG (beta-lactamase superfamily)